jgi:hypothetical protein
MHRDPIRDIRTVVVDPLRHVEGAVGTYRKMSFHGRGLDEARRIVVATRRNTLLLPEPVRRNAATSENLDATCSKPPPVGWIERRDAGVRTRLIGVLLVVHLLHGAPARSACGQHGRWGGTLGGGVQVRGGDADSTAHGGGRREEKSSSSRADNARRSQVGRWERWWTLSFRIPLTN